MTCIVGMIDKKNKKVYIGGDSAGVSGLDIRIRKDVKVFKVGDFVMGGTSSFRMLQLLRFSFRPPVIGELDLYEYMCTKFVNEVRKTFKDGGYLINKDGAENGGVFLIGHKDRLFYMDNDFQVGECSDVYDSCGCGESYALGSLYTSLKGSASTKEKVLKALETASYFSGGVCKPFVVINT